MEFPGPAKSTAQLLFPTQLIVIPDDFKKTCERIHGPNMSQLRLPETSRHFLDSSQISSAAQSMAPLATWQLGPSW